MHIIEAIRKKEYSGLLSLGISRAYDTCRKRGILNTLKTWKVNGRMLGFAKNFMSSRTLRVAVESTLSSPMNIENGLVQRAVLSVTLFLVAMATICKGIEEPTKTLGHIHEPTDTTNGRKQVTKSSK
jgi:hypothetical protein